MSFSSIKQQKEFFYSSKWSREMDNVLLSSLARQKNTYQWKSSNIPAEAMTYVCFDVHEMFPGILRWGEVYERKDHLLLRYRTFKEILSVPGTHWDVQQHCIFAADKIWKQIFRGNNFAKAYYYNDEPEFEKLATIFGDDEIKVESGKTVIIISDTTQVVEENQENNSNISDDEEVMSPNLRKPRRRLFDDMCQLQDVGSTNNKGDETLPLVNAFPMKPKEKDSNARMTAGSSSCASSSPSKWWKNLFM